MIARLHCSFAVSLLYAVPENRLITATKMKAANAPLMDVLFTKASSFKALKLTLWRQHWPYRPATSMESVSEQVLTGLFSHTFLVAS
jgi:hypothetical protein